MFQRIAQSHSQGQAVKKNEGSFELLDPGDDSAMILLDKGNHSPNNAVPFAVRLESSVTLL
jgi:hypothetical protein